MMGKNSIAEITERFSSMEKTASLFEIKVGGVGIWQYIRYYCYNRIMIGLDVYGQAHSGIDEGKGNLLRMSLGALKSYINKNPLSAKGDYKVLAFMQGKRKLGDDGFYWNIYLDPVISEMPDKVLAMEGIYEKGHKNPPKTKDIKYLDSMLAKAYLKSKLMPVKLDAADNGGILEIEKALKQEFGLDIGLENEVGKRLSLRRELRKSIGRILEKYRPRVVLEVCYYGMVNMVLNELCKERGIPTAELQHGTIGEYHMAYNFPKGVGVGVFPDYFLSFGKYWEEQVNLPIPKKNIFTCGYPYLEEEAKKFKKKGKSRQVLFISQGTIGRDLSRIAVEFAEKSDYDVVYKLHPGEYSRWKEEYPWLVDSKVGVIDNDEIPFYQLLADSCAQVGVYSTAIYEGLVFGLKAVIVDLTGYEHLQSLIKSGHATKVSDAAEILRVLESKGNKGFNSGYFFEKNSLKTQKRFVGRFL
jgi:hypothetical protein